MQDAMTIVITATAVLFAVAAIVDFTAGLAATWRNAGTKAQPQVELKPASEQPIVARKAISPQVEPEMIAPEIEPVLQEETRYSATLQWIEQNMPVPEVYAVELSDAIALAKAKLPKIAPVVEIASKQQLINAGIRKCKKLASQLKIRRYNTMKLAELADALVGRVLLSELLA